MIRSSTIVTVLGIVAALGLAASDQAQETEFDWELVRSDTAVAALTQFDNGLALIVRCTEGRSLNAMVTGLPPGTGHSRRLVTYFEGGEGETAEFDRLSGRDERDWGVGANPAIAFSRYPAGLARRLRQGGTMNVVVPGAAENGRNLRYVVDLPSSPTAVEAVLNDCGRSLRDPRRDAEIEALDDSGLPRQFVWVRRPRIEYPSGRTYERGFVTVSCFSQTDGRLEDCIIESEQPEGGGFAQAVLNATRKGQVRNDAAPDGPVPRALVMYNALFTMEDTNADRSSVRRLRSGSRER